MIYKKRHLEAHLGSLSTSFPAIWINGPRQSGKTTLAKSAFPDFAYVSFEDLDIRKFGSTDPRGFLRKFPTRVILDEVQKCPEIVPYLQTHLDKNGSNGQFILTGSHQFQLARSISQSLAGRAAVITLLPFSLSELYGIKGQEPGMFDIRPENVLPVEIDIESVFYKGMYPAVHDRNANPSVWYSSYYATYIERDVREISGVTNLSLFDTFVRLCAARAGCLINYSDLATATGISIPTAKSWLSVLEISGIIKLVQPYFANFSKRLVKSPKIYFIDNGLLSYLLRINDPIQLSFHPLKGQFFENCIVSEIIKSFYNKMQEPPVYFWRDNTDHEIDVVLDYGTSLLPIEIKLAETISSSMAKTLKWWLALQNRSADKSIVLYGGDSSRIINNVLYRSWRAPL